MHYCPNCGTPIEDGSAKFCSACGTPLNTTDEQKPFNNQEQVNTENVETPSEQATSQENENAKEPTPAKQVNEYRETLRTNRGLAKYFFLSLITFGIYGIVVMSHISTEINDIATKHDGRKTMHYCLIYFIFSWLTFGIAPLVWYHRLSERIGNELIRRRLPYSFGAGTWWGWGFFGALLFGIGPLIYIHKLMKAMNILAADYNVNG